MRNYSVAKVQPRRKSLGKFYLLLGVIVVAAVAAIAINSRPPKQDTFQVDPNLPPVAVEGYLMGDPNAPVRVREWADFECPTCAEFAAVTAPDLRELARTGQISYEYFFFPITQIHRSAAAAAYAAACAGDQGIDQFWAMHDAIYAGYNDWAAGRARNPRGVFLGYARQIGLDTGAWEACYDSDKFHDLITAHLAEGMRRGINGTPSFVIGDVLVAGSIPYDRMKMIIDSVAATAPRAPAPSGDSTVALPVGGN